MWKLNNTFLTNQWVREEIRRYFEANENENTTYQNLCGVVKIVHRGKFIAANQ